MKKFFAGQANFIAGILSGAFITGMLYLFVAFITWDFWFAGCATILRTIFAISTISAWSYLYGKEEESNSKGPADSEISDARCKEQKESA